MDPWRSVRRVAPRGHGAARAHAIMGRRGSRLACSLTHMHGHGAWQVRATIGCHGPMLTLTEVRPWQHGRRRVRGGLHHAHVL